MKASELIKVLQNVVDNDGDVEVVVSFRDAGGSYGGYTTDLESRMGYDLSCVEMITKPSDFETFTVTNGELDKAFIL